jgi:glycosyltransferase involved in cell wall biosynthesis
MPGLLSVVMPTYNGERYVAAALESLLGQRDGEVELIVVDDGSSDGTVGLVERLTRGTPTRLLRPGRLGSWVAASNLGLREARGEWCCFLHQDDLWLPGRLVRLRAELPRCGGALLLHDARYVDPAGESLGEWTCPLAPGDVAPESFVERLLTQNFIAIPSPTFRRAAALAQGGLDERLWFSADWDLWLRLGAVGPVRYLPETLAAFRLHPESQTAARPVGEREWARQLGTVLERHLARWPATGAPRRRVERSARVSVAVNSALAAAARGAPVAWGPVAWQALGLGPVGWHRYLRDSRLFERVGARLRLRRRLARALPTPP